MVKSYLSIFLILVFILNFQCDKSKKEIQLDENLNWTKGSVWYQIFPERFYNGNSSNDPSVVEVPENNNPNWRVSPWKSDWYKMQRWERQNRKPFYDSSVVFARRYGGDLIGVIQKLDYLEELGINAIYFNPVFEAESLHKYDAETYHHIDDNFGPDRDGDKISLLNAQETEDPTTWIWTKADSIFLKLIHEAHSRGIKIVIDGVFNHTGITFFAFEDILQNTSQSRYVDWYNILAWDDPNTPEDEFDFKCWRGYKIHPEFAEDENGLLAGPKEYLFNITRKWMDPNGDSDPSDGIDGWRLDAAVDVAVPFWREWNALVKSINPTAITVAEIWEDASEWIKDKRLNNTMNYPFAYAVCDFFIDQTTKISGQEFSAKLQTILNQYGKNISHILWNLVDSHDTDRLASMIINPDRDFDRNSGLRDNPDFIVRKPNKAELKIQKQILAFQMTFIGAPVIYYGDEAGMWGADDPDDRKPMIWPEMEFDDEISHPLPNKTRPIDKNSFDQDLFDYYKKMINLRQSTPALKIGDVELLNDLNTEDIFVFKRFTKKQQVVILFNRSENTKEVTLKKDIFKYSNYSDPINDKDYILKNGDLTINIEDNWYSILISQ